MAIVAGVLLDHVADDPSDAGRLDVGRRSPDDTAEPVGPQYALRARPGSGPRSVPTTPISPQVCCPPNATPNRSPSRAVSQGGAMSRPRS